MIKVIYTSTHRKYVLYLLMMLFWLSLHANGGHRKTTCIPFYHLLLQSPETGSFSEPGTQLAASESLVSPSHSAAVPGVHNHALLATSAQSIVSSGPHAVQHVFFPLGPPLQPTVTVFVLSFYPVTTLIHSQAQSFLYRILSEVLYKRLCLLHPFHPRCLSVLFCTPWQWLYYL